MIGVLVASIAIPLLVRRVGWYGTLRMTSFRPCRPLPSHRSCRCYSEIYDGCVGWRTGVVLLLVLIAYEIGENSFTRASNRCPLADHQRSRCRFADRAPPGCLARFNGLSLSAASIGRMLAPALSGLVRSTFTSIQLTIVSQLGRFASRSSTSSDRTSSGTVFTLIALIWSTAALRLEPPIQTQREDIQAIGSYGAIGVGGSPVLKASASEVTLCGEEVVKWFP